VKRHRHNDIYVDAALVLLALLVAAAAGAVAKAEGILGPAHLCSSTGQVCAKELPNLYGVNGVGFVTTSTATAVDYGTGYGTGTGTGVGNVTYTLTGTGTATDTTSASDTAAISGNINTNTITVTTTATSTTVRTQTLTTVYTWQHNLTSTKTFVGTGTITATATATATITATITATATDFGTGTGTFTTTTTATATGTKSSVVSGTYAGTATCTGSWTNSTTMTYTGTWAQTATSTGTGTRTITVTLTQTGTVSATKTGTSTLSMSGTATHTGTDTTATASVTGTASGAATGTWTSTANTTATSTTVASNPTITYTTPADPQGTMYLVAGAYIPSNGTPSSSFLAAPSGESLADPSLTLTAGGALQDFFGGSNPCDPTYAFSGACSLVNRPELATDAKWIQSGTITVVMWAKATSATLAQWHLGTTDGLVNYYITFNISGVAWTRYTGSVAVPNGFMIPANGQFFAYLGVRDVYSGSPTITVGATASHYTSINGPWLAGDRSGLARTVVVPAVPVTTTVTSGILTAYTYGRFTGYADIEATANLKNTGGGSAECLLYIYSDSSQVSVNSYALPSGADVTAIARVQDIFLGNSITVKVGAASGGTCTADAIGGNVGGRFILTPTNPSVVPR
jgi:hypothetical protein